MDIQTTIILVNLLILIVVLIMSRINYKLFKSILLTPLAGQFIKINEYESSNKNLSYLLFYLLTFFTILLSIQFYELTLSIPFLNEFLITDNKNGFLWIYGALIIGTLLFLKTAADRLIMYILDLNKDFKSYINYKFLLANYCLISLAPVILFTEYNDYSISISFHQAIIGLSIIYITGQLIYFYKNDKQLIDNLHYIILYLCTFEFGTYFIIYQMMID